MSKILIIEDDPAIVDYLRTAFQVNWPEIEFASAGFGIEGIARAQAESPDLVILDLGLPDIDGFEVLKTLRKFPRILIVILTARSDEKDIVKGLELGADDYVVKPFRQLELIARVRTLLRRQPGVPEQEVLHCGKLTLDTGRNDISTSSGSRIELTRTESIILAQLIRNCGRVVDHSKLAEIIWGEDYPGSVNALRVYIGRLRRKLETDAASPAFILSKAGQGYYVPAGGPPG
ncbi:two-component system, OmpR family, KDP operon response regulator KdpE [Dehalogenimonas formicexedens]|uniref:Two-component system, OmpR family, KDP operon response regulator KdpE n=1 Tax=Dehalogenimonas formicexedens TaxID=1839801 RepID=A0A1P8F7X7_9CHLR|nr:response regulator transcription factor [Dehalogenimonas formicexedens]APV44533.1 two-component system, OmpR family, KDP operon response regulator KdpE [Dehalogenimonas formicexedens]